MKSLFLEVSAKTNANVSLVFQNVVEQIIDTPSLWDPAKGGKAAEQSTSNGGGGMPGGVQVVGQQPQQAQSGGCC